MAHWNQQDGNNLWNRTGPPPQIRQQNPSFASQPPASHIMPATSPFGAGVSARPPINSLISPTAPTARPFLPGGGQMNQFAAPPPYFQQPPPPMGFGKNIAVNSSTDSSTDETDQMFCRDEQTGEYLKIGAKKTDGPTTTAIAAASPASKIGPPVFNLQQQFNPNPFPFVTQQQQQQSAAAAALFALQGRPSVSLGISELLGAAAMSFVGQQQQQQQRPPAQLLNPLAFGNQAAMLQQVVTASLQQPMVQTQMDFANSDFAQMSNAERDYMQEKERMGAGGEGRDGLNSPERSSRKDEDDRRRRRRSPSYDSDRKSARYGSSSRRSRSRSRERSSRRRSSRSRSRSKSPSYRRRDRNTLSRSRSRSPASSNRRRRSPSPNRDRDRRSPTRSYRQRHAPNRVIAIRGLPQATDENQIWDIMDRDNVKPIDVRIMRFKEGGQSRGFGFVEFSTVADAEVWMDRKQGRLDIDDRCTALLDYDEAKREHVSDGARYGDWACAKCSVNNFKKRDRCFQCGMDRDESITAVNEGLSSMGTAPCDTLVLCRLPQGICCDEAKITQSISRVTSLDPLSVRLAPSRRFAYLQMRTPVEAGLMIAALTGFAIEGHALLVSYAKKSLTALLLDGTFAGTGAPLPFGMNQTDAANAAAAVAQIALQKSVNRHQSELADRRSDNGRSAETQSDVATALGTVMTPYGELPRYPVPDTRTYQYEPKSGYYYDASTGLYYDGDNSRYYYNPETQQWLYWEGSYATFLPATSTNTMTKTTDAARTDTVASSAGSTATTVTASTADDPEKKEKEKKVKIAKDVAKDMEKWAKQQNKLKKKSGVAAVPMTASMSVSDVTTVGADEQRTTQDDSAPILIPAELTSDTPRSKKADVGFSILQKSKLAQSSLGVYESRESDDDFSTAPSTLPSSSVASGVQASPAADTTSAGGSKDVDWDRIACLLCRRQFPSKDVLMKHCQKSDLHKKNLALKNERTKPTTTGGNGNYDPPVINSSPAPSPANIAMHREKYRDRAAERRQKLGVGIAPVEAPKHDPLREKYMAARVGGPSSSGPSASFPAASTVLTSDNAGHKLMKSMGWQEGQGLGRANQGIVNPITQERRVAGAGLGLKATAPVLDPANYKAAVYNAMRDRFNELE